MCGPKRTVSEMGYTPQNFMEPDIIQLSSAAQRMQATNSPIGGVYTPPRASAAEKPYQAPEGRAVYWPESERYGDPPDLPSLLLANRVIYIAMPVRACHHTRTQAAHHIAASVGTHPVLLLAVVAGQHQP